jgi:hypothetical protein
MMRMTKHLLPPPRSTPFFSVLRVSTSLGTWMRFVGWASLSIVLVVNIATRIPLHIPKQMYTLLTLLYPSQNNLKPANVLGATNAPSMEEQRGALEKTYAYWQSVAEQHPDYRDAHLMLAQIAFTLGENDKVRAHVERAKQIDPNAVVINYFADLEE